MRVRSFVIAAALALVWAGSAIAHHSFAMFDLTKPVTLKGVVKQFQWTNPHAWLEIDVPNDQGGVDMWGVEFNSPNNLSRAGWKRTMLKPGDKVTVTVGPLRDGQRGGLFLEAILADGKTMTDPMMRLRPQTGPGAPPPGAPPAPAPASPDKPAP